MKTIARADFKVRFNDSALGYFWYLLKPLALFAVLLTVFSYLMRFDGVSNYGLRLLIGIMMWDFFSSGSLIGIDSLWSKGSLLTKVYFPREIIVFSGNITAFLTLFFNMIVLWLFLTYYGIYPTLQWLFIPVLIIPMALILMGVSFGLGALKVFYGDVLHIWEILVQLMFWGTPIIYPLSVVPEHIRKFIILNPFAFCIESARNIFLSGQLPSAKLYLWAVGVGVIVFLCGYALFRRLEPKFAEEL
jgi:lipopolysaccharide transport system permease protein